MPANESDRAWEWYGARDPYFGVLTDERFRGATLSDQARAEFFASGERYVEALWEAIGRHTGVELAPARTLEFGCGVGRVLIPLSLRSARVVGVDVSPSMLAEARRNCEAAGVRNADLVRADDGLSQVTGTFDFVHSYIVFQHIPVARGETLTRRMLALLEEGGIGALHYTYDVRISRRLRASLWARRHVPLLQPLANLARGRPLAAATMQMNEYSLSRIIGILHEAGCDEICGRATIHGDDSGVPAGGVMLIFRKLRRPAL
jgi:SAM-dependent methyltransferase